MMKSKQRNPFVIGGYVSPDYFCDRNTESDELLTAILNSRNTAIISPRRMGKTGLVQHCFHFPEVKNNFHTFFIDIYSTGSLKEFVFILGKEIFDSLKPKGRRVIDHFFEMISSLRPAFKLDVLTGAPMFDIGIGEIVKPEYSLEQIFTYLESANKHCVIAIDEFQQIAKYPEKNIEAILRTHIQKCTNTTFIFAGSRHHMMQNIFFSPSRPFYQSVSLIHLGSIDSKEYQKFVIRHMKHGEKAIDHELVERVYNLFEGHTWYIQNIFHHLYALMEPGETCTLQMVDHCVRSTVNSFEPIFEGILSLLPERQKEVIYAIAKEGKAREVTSSHFIRKHGLKSSSTTQSALRQLLEKEFITREKDVYMVYDRFFGLWLAEKFGTGYTV
jgi:AAA+ ATPase superfamily predicted ATPase